MKWVDALLVVFILGYENEKKNKYHWEYTFVPFCIAHIIAYNERHLYALSRHMHLCTYPLFIIALHILLQFYKCSNINKLLTRNYKTKHNEFYLKMFKKHSSAYRYNNNFHN